MRWKDNLADLIKVKTIVTLSVVFVFVSQAMCGEITPDHVMTVTTTVLAFYFGTQHERGSGG